MPIGPHFWHNKADTLLCNDSALKDCFLFRTIRDAEWEPIHPMLVSGDCFAYYNGQPWMRVGTSTADKQGCERDGHVIPVGQTLKPELDTAGYYCYDEPDKASKQTFDSELSVGMVCRGHCFGNGLIMRAVGDRMIIAPPLTMTHAQIDEMVALILRCLDLTLEDVKSRGWLA